MAFFGRTERSSLKSSQTTLLTSLQPRNKSNPTSHICTEASATSKQAPCSGVEPADLKKIRKMENLSPLTSQFKKKKSLSLHDLHVLLCQLGTVRESGESGESGDQALGGVEGTWLKGLSRSSRVEFIAAWRSSVAGWNQLLLCSAGVLKHPIRMIKTLSIGSNQVKWRRTLVDLFWGFAFVGQKGVKLKAKLFRLVQRSLFPFGFCLIFGLLRGGAASYPDCGWHPQVDFTGSLLEPKVIYSKFFIDSCGHGSWCLIELKFSQY